MNTENSSVYLDRAMEVGVREMNALKSGDTENSSVYLDRAMEVGVREMNALKSGDTELALELADRRSWLISQAWNVRVEFDENYYSKLLEVQRMQDALTDEARRQRDAIRDSLIHSRREGLRLAGYKKAAGYAV